MLMSYKNVFILRLVYWEDFKNEWLCEWSYIFGGLICTFVFDDVGMVGNPELFYFEVIILDIVNIILNMDSDIWRVDNTFYIALKEYVQIIFSLGLWFFIIWRALRRGITYVMNT